MNSSLFFDWLCHLDRKIGQSKGQKIFLLIDNCSAHQNLDTIPNLTHVEIDVLPPSTTNKLQPLDAGIISAIKVRYRWRQIKHGGDLLEVGERDL